VPIVTLPDGKEISFPDGMSPMDISAALRPGTPAGEFIGSILDPKSLQPYKEIAKPYLDFANELAKDIIPGISHLRSVERIGEINERNKGDVSPIRRLLNNADIALEGAGMAADFVPGLKGLGLAAGSLAPLAKRLGKVTPMAERLNQRQIADRRIEKMFDSSITNERRQGPRREMAVRNDEPTRQLSGLTRLDDELQ
jgi:hypothetical protein